ncbi:hypothetical protein JOM56_014239, partial [Amanita muscaria]
DYVQEFVDRIDELLQATLSREAMPVEKKFCLDCADNNWATWRCVDCTLANPVCRKCMCRAHRHSPFHRIEHWTSTHFHPAELWEVGTYVLIQHHEGRATEDIAGFKPYLPCVPDGEGEIPNARCPDPDADDRNLPGADALNNLYVRIVHTNGIHHLAMVTCSCQGEHRVSLNLVASGLLPASFSRICTLFSAQVLDYFRLCNLELKASAYQFYQLTCRLTMPILLAEVINLYHEFRRMSRLWHWMKKLKWAGYGHNKNDILNPAAGVLANFCPACPQPDVNLPDNWKEDDNKFVFQRMLAADGNFKADHVRQKNPDNDIWLWDGGGMAPNQYDYSQFLQIATERSTVSACQNTFHAITNALLASNVCDITGLVGIACARHGCYAPNTLVNLFIGEQQKNVDFAFLQALKTTGVDPQQGVILFYDIACQYFVHFQDRIGHLLPAGLNVDRAIGLFHVHAHKEECFFRFAPSFIPGSGIVAGEILESLWSALNAISPMARTATLPHRAEMLDDHACDSNHKKLLGMSIALCSRHRHASTMMTQTTKYYSELAATAGPVAINAWESEIQGAEAMRLADAMVMDIYAARSGDLHSAGKDLASGTGSGTGTAGSLTIQQWLEFALLVEEKNRDVHDSDWQLIERGRQALALLMSRVKQLQHAAGLTEPTSPIVPELDDEAEFVLDDEPAPAPAPISTAPIPVEKEILLLPSNGNLVKNTVIANKSFQYSHVIRAAPRKSVRTRGRDRVKELDRKLVEHAQIYCRCRVSLVALGADEETLHTFRVLHKDDMKASTAILTPNIPGSSALRLSWIWKKNQLTGTVSGLVSDANANIEDPAAILEC